MIGVVSLAPGLQAGRRGWSGRFVVLGSARASHQSPGDLLRRTRLLLGRHVGATLHPGHPDRAACVRVGRDPPLGAVLGPGPRTRDVAREHQTGVALGAGVLGEILERLERQIEEDPGPPAVVARDRRPVVRNLVREVVLRDAASLCGPDRDRSLDREDEPGRWPIRLVDSGDRSAGGASYRIVAPGTRVGGIDDR